MVALDTQLPNGYVGRRAFPIEAEGRLADFGTAIYPTHLRPRDDLSKGWF